MPQMVAVEVPVLFSKACEVMTREIAYRAYLVAKESRRRTILVRVTVYVVRCSRAAVSYASCRRCLCVGVCSVLRHRAGHREDGCVRLPHRSRAARRREDGSKGVCSPWRCLPPRSRRRHSVCVGAQTDGINKPFLGAPEVQMIMQHVQMAHIMVRCPSVVHCHHCRPR
jgi:hypothetical protein